MRPHRTRTLTALLLAGTALAATPTAASAGTYEVLTCGAANGANNSWTAEVSTPAITAANLCTSPGTNSADDPFITFGGTLALYTALGAPNPSAGSYAYWRIDVPDPLRITADRGAFNGHSEADGWRLVVESDAGELGHCQMSEMVNDSCVFGGGQPAGTPLDSTTTTYAQPARWVRVGFRCTAAPCDTGTTAHAAGIALYSAAMTVSDPVAPVVGLSGVPGSVASGGVVRATVSGGDQTGISRLELLVDGEVVAASPRSCDFSRVLPCEAPGGQVSAQLSSRELGPGSHVVQGRAVDAAGNVSTTGSSSVIAQAPQTTPSTPAPTPTPAPSGGGMPTPTPAPGGAVQLRSAALKISSVRRTGSRVRVRGSVAAGCPSRLTVRVIVGGRRRTARVTAARSGRWGTWVSGVRRRGRVTVRVSAASTASCRAASVRTSRG